MKHVLAAGLAVIFLLIMICGLVALIESMSPSAVAIDTAHSAVELARDVAEQSSTALLWAGRWRLLAIVLGISEPLVIAYLIWRGTGKLEPAASDMLAEVADRGLLQLPEQEPSQQGRRLSAAPTNELTSLRVNAKPRPMVESAPGGAVG